MHPAAFLVLGCSAAASAYQIAQGLAARRFFRRAARAAARWPSDWRPPVTILKPLKGEGLDLYANLASFCRQDYPSYQIVFGVSRPDDPAVAVVERIRRDFPDRDVTLAVGSEPGANRKVANLVQMMRHARHDVLVLSDADIRVRPDYLRTMVAPLSEPRVGLTTCLYRGRGYFGLPSVMESLYLNTIFVPMVMMAQWVQEFRYAYGASIALKREALEASGGFAPLADYLADDYLLGNRVHAAGFELVLLPYVVETVLDSVTMGDLWRHLLRWARTYRVCQPFNWFLTIITHTTLWGLLAVLASGGAPAGWALLAAALACRLGSLRDTMRLLREHEALRQLWLVPLSDLGYSTLWLASWLGRQVDWSGQRLRVERDGRMVPVGPVLAPPAVGSEPPGRDQLHVGRPKGAADARA
ncbi:MAG TPA: bacteriohopanetetrol glucosamine biosynthesis glycosyltransferase HpnI [Candidatus Binatia bacterium]|nr:bacteriohopanetetrol glucosamine biosynthesis glycosyltransferase HpnI [Candidatus Binatia bacterium]